MSKAKYFLSLFLLWPTSILAQGRDVLLANDEVAYASIFAGNFSLLLSIVIGIIAMMFVLRAAKKMGGGLFGSVLNYIAAGMFLVVLGTMASFVDAWLSVVWFNVINTVCFATGYIFMVIGANKLLKGIMNN
jgi:hypothetical protein